MRGDSLRDLYAKTLALAGLGVLAGAGVLVDYWPVGITFPRVSAALPLSPLAPALSSAQDSPIDATPGGTSALVVRAAASRPMPVSASAARSVFLTLAASEATSSLGTALDLELPTPAPAPEREPVTTIAQHESAAVLAASANDTGLDAAAFTLIGEPATLAATDHGDDDGFVTDAFKKTGTSIVRTSRRTGTSIVDAVRVVSSVVKRALPY